MQSIPLLKDWHTHPLLYAVLRDGMDLNSPAVASSDHAVEVLSARARRGQMGWTIGYGWNSGRFALAQSAFDDLPPVVVLNLSLHGIIVNRAGRELLARTDAVVAEHLDDVDWLERNLRRVLNVFATSGATAERLREFFDWLLRVHGVYSLDEMLLVDENEIRLIDEADLAGRVRFWAAPETYEALAPEMQHRIQGIKLFTDGAIGAWTAALHQPYRGTGSAGILLYSIEELSRLIRRYAGQGIPMAIHAIGDRAIDQIVEAVEIARPEPGVELRIEHAQLISERSARRAKELGLSLCMQPNFSDDSRHYAERLPPGYAERNNPFRMLIDRAGFRPGFDLWFGSDGMPHGVQEALRQSLFPPFPSQRLTIDEFVAGYGLEAPDVGWIEIDVNEGDESVGCRVHLSDPRR